VRKRFTERQTWKEKEDEMNTMKEVRPCEEEIH
jgi:hypothetical protein